MNSYSICAVIVTYHPTLEMLDSLPKVLAQVDGLVVVDNGSHEHELQSLRVARNTLGFELVENRDNLGIAEALNQGVRQAKSSGYPWVILFDQDSKITDGFVALMQASLFAHPHRARVASMHPRYVNKETGVEANVLRAKDGGPVKSLTSGSMMPSWIFDKVGFFASEYFIDEVDSEFCYRIRAAGYLIADSKQAILLHSVGHPKLFSILGFTCLPTNQSPTRRYYMSRNRVVLYRKYLPVFPRWVLQSMVETFRETVKCFVAEEDRTRKMRNFVLGMWDAMIGRMGQRSDV